jgi:hypothetical protein
MIRKSGYRFSEKIMLKYNAFSRLRPPQTISYNANNAQQEMDDPWDKTSH